MIGRKVLFVYVEIKMAKAKHEGRPFSYTWSEKKFEEALSIACCQLGIDFFSSDKKKAEISINRIMLKFPLRSYSYL